MKPKARCLSQCRVTMPGQMIYNICLYEILFKENKRLKGDLEEAHDNLRIRDEAIENLKNDLFTTNNRLVALDAQITKERDKVLQLRDDKKLFTDKV